ncbi:MAG: hypothetical protein GY720_23060 [bacterium]|nr:hypothetical protein [bacterium]
MPMFKRSLGLVASLVMVAAACGGTDDATPTTAANASTAAPISIDVAGNPAAYCAALQSMFESQPAGTFTSNQVDSEFIVYAEAIEAAMQHAPSDQADALRNLAEFVRDTAVDPTAEGTAERAFALVGAMFAINTHAEQECGIDVEALASTNTVEAPPIRTDVEIDAGSIDAANAGVPAGIDISFESVATAGEYPVLAVVPVGWDMEEFFGFTFEPPEDSDLGFFTEIRFGDGCDGICAPKDWTVIMDDLESGPFSMLSGKGTVLVDETLTNPTGRLVVYEDPDAFSPIVVVAARWSEAADRYFKCEANLDDGDEALWVAMAAACEASVPLWIPVD